MRRYVSAILVGCLVLVGCGAGNAGKATPEDKENLQNLIQNGIGGSPPPGGDAPAPGETPPPANGAVEAP